jgi:hypothetical protein
VKKRLQIPAPVLAFFAIDLCLGSAYVLGHLAGRPRGFARLLDLNLENNLPTWYSAIQWFCVAGLLAVFSVHNLRRSDKKSWLLMSLPVAFLGMSIDEVASIHEGIGRMSDALLPGNTREGTLFRRTGIWMFLVGTPFVVLFLALIRSVRTYFGTSPGALAKIGGGVACALAGALGLEVLSNFVAPGSTGSVVQIVTEEMCELMGATLVLWGSWQLLVEHGFAIKLEKVSTDRAATAAVAASHG